MIKKAIFPAIILLILTVFLLSYFDSRYILLNTTPTGGDTPAHNYLVRHLKESFFSRGAVISYAGGWWCGFPMYQYYFFFPYFMMALFSFIIPLNIAFKIVTILGIVCLPLAVYFSMKWMNFDDFTACISSILSIPFLFVDTHTMWGVNIYSTLAGEISNSISFVFFVLFLGSFYKDMLEIKFRLRTAALFTLLFYSHFFTSVIAGSVAFFLLFLFDLKNIRKRTMVLIKTNALTFLLIAWWMVPLLAKSAYSVEMGGDWNIALWKTFPFYMIGLVPPILYALGSGILRKRNNEIFFIILLLISLFAFYTGGKINASFTNIRFWPFIYYALMVLAAIGISRMIDSFRGKELMVGVILLTILLLIANSKNNVRGWVKWNNEGLESKDDYATFRDLVLPLDKTPGRLANDLHAYNDHLGSSRVFETVPALIDKSILEGGIVNSATGSMFSYYIQGETSQGCAGFPTVVNPTTFNIENGTKHMKLSNVKHFIAYWDKTKAALSKHPEWKLLKNVGQYQLFELKTNDGSYVYIPKNRPLAVKTKHWKERTMEWIYTIKALDQPFILSYQGQKSAAGDAAAVLTDNEYLEFLSGLSRQTDEIPLWLTLGPFNYSAGIGEEKAADLEFVKINEIKPASGAKQQGKIWQPLLRQGPIFLDGIYQSKYNFICYNYVGIVSEAKQKALLHYSNDDQARIYLEGKLVAKTAITGLQNYRTAEVTLKPGINRLIYKVQQGVGGVFFHARLTDLAGRPFNNVTYSISQTMPQPKISATNSGAIVEEEVGNDRIRFRTKALHQPHIIKFSYFPNWQVKGAKRIYHVTPNFMLVYPEQEEVTLYYGSLPVDIAGRLLTLFGAIIAVGIIWSKKR